MRENFRFAEVVREEIDVLTLKALANVGDSGSPLLRFVTEVPRTTQTL